MKHTLFSEIPQFTRSSSYQCDYPITRISAWVNAEIAESELQLCPDFQRGHVWTEEQQVAYLEFLLKGGRTGRDFYFNSPTWRASVADTDYADFVCVDGLQRLTAIRRFIENEIKVFGSYFREYEDPRKITGLTVRIHINDLRTKAEVLTWYVEMNAGGTPHTSDEIKRVRRMIDELR